MSLPDTAPKDVPPDAAPDLKAQADRLVAEGKKAIALKDWEQGAEKYADALDIMRQIVGDFDPAMAPLLLTYGRALYEVAFAQQGVMGREQVDKQAAGPAAVKEDDAPAASSSNFVFGGDAPDEEDDVEGEGEDEGGQAVDGEGAQDGAEGDGEDEPEDDYNAAWEVLDVARTIYAKKLEGMGDDEAKHDRLCLSECYLSLGDISLETENFPQAVQDYTEALKIKSALFPSSSRVLASVHYQLATVLEFTPDGRDDALKHVESALAGLKARLAEINGAEKVSDEVAKLTDKERKIEKKDTEGLIADLELKIEELKAAPPANDPVSESIKHLLGAGGEGAFGPLSSAAAGGSGAAEALTPVNDLTSMVKKKKKPAAPNPAPAVDKRKTEEGEESEAKKAKTE